MTYRMLLGRSAIDADMVVDPNRSFVQPELSFDLYRHTPRRKPIQRPLRIAARTSATWHGLPRASLACPSRVSTSCAARTVRRCSRSIPPPGLQGIEAVTKKDIAGQIISHLEGRVRPLSKTRESVTRRGVTATSQDSAPIH
jgi:hypothetical protein